LIEAFPLYWPEGWKRTPARERRRSTFRVTTGQAIDGLLNEIRLLDGENEVISTNVPVRRDGMLYASFREPDDPGVAVYFTVISVNKKNPKVADEKRMCFACDQYGTVRENLQAIGLTIAALRGIERWGASDMMERAFRGFAALPEASWRQALGLEQQAAMHGYGTEHCQRQALLEDVERRFRELAHQTHPDKGGNAEQFDLYLKARMQARKELGADP
jgi:hypothetical protein